MEWQEKKSLCSSLNLLEAKTLVMFFYVMFCMQNLNVVSGTKHGHCSLVSLLLR